MIGLLVLLTGINFFIYGQNDKAVDVYALQADLSDNPEFPEDAGNTQPAGPDEKVPDRPVSFNEEYLHEQHEAAAPLTDILIHHLLLVYSKIHPVHFELITPPPDRHSC